MKKDLEQAANEFAWSNFSNNHAKAASIRGFKARAQWQAEHTEDYPMPEDTVLFQKGVEEGKRLMMEEAIEGRVIETYNPATEEGKPYLHGITLIYEDKNKPYLTVGDIFKFAIIEEEDE
jgi:hypothetical protein